jgi:hypothetical protein
MPRPTYFSKDLIYSLSAQKTDGIWTALVLLNDTQCRLSADIIPSVTTRNQILMVKVKCILVQALRHCTGRTAYRGSRGKALLFQDHGTRRG